MQNDGNPFQAATMPKSVSIHQPSLSQLVQRTGQLSRRSFLDWAAGGFGGLALTTLLSADGQAKTHHVARAKRVIQIFCPGGMSQVDTFDYKPELERRMGKPF